jgi:cytochrome c-type biogenesis protein CcmH
VSIQYRWIPALAAGALLALLAVVGLTALRDAPPTVAQQSEELAAELRCPDCAGVSVAESPTRPAAEIRRQIRLLLDEGRTPDEVRQHFVDRYGEWILLAPRPAVAWLAPALVLLAGIVILVAWLRPASRRRAGDDVRDAAPPGDRRRVHDEADALDA